MQNHKIVAIIPAFNEGRTIGAVVSSAVRYVDEVIVIDDGSIDDTAKQAIIAGAYIHRHPSNLSYGEAIKTGFRVALQRGASLAVIIDGDGQHDPIYIPFILQPVFHGRADVVIASRFLCDRKCIPFIRRLGISLVNFLFNRLYNSSISDTQSGFRVFSKRAMYLLDLKEKGMGISVEILASAIQHGFIIKELPVPCEFHNVGNLNLALIAQGLTVVRAMIIHRHGNPCRSGSILNYHGRDSEYDIKGVGYSSNKE